jgi:putative ABC transport system permease protein
MSGGGGSLVDIRLNPKMSTHNSLAKIESVFKQYDPASPFDYKFTDEEYARKFSSEERVGQTGRLFYVVGYLHQLYGFIRHGIVYGRAAHQGDWRAQGVGGIGIQLMATDV